MQNYTTNIQANRKVLNDIFKEVVKLKKPNDKKVEKILRKHPDVNGKILSKGAVIRGINELSKEDKFISVNLEKFLSYFKMKRTRTISGVAPITVLTKPFPCPGKCIFCPNDVRMPKSYLANEPGAQRAESNKFDPFLQTHNRLVALHQTGHKVSKAELIILGGTWSSYPESYQVWFVKRCFDAMNNFENSNKDFYSPKHVKNPLSKKPHPVKGERLTKSYNQVISKALDYQQTLKEKASWNQLKKVQNKNVNSGIKCVGLSIETRPDEITTKEVLNLRKLGATKVQIGVQSMSDKVLKLNKRGHNVKKTEESINMLRIAGFKIQVHYMPNLYGSSPKEDVKDFKKLYTNLSIRPDELKIYPCSLIDSAELMKYYKKGLWKPYKKEELLQILTEIELSIPEYTRVTRIVRDIPGTDIVTGNKITNFRQIVEDSLKANNIKIKEIRNREIKTRKVLTKDLHLKIVDYETTVSNEKFLQFVNNENRLAGFLRLSLPKNKTNTVTKELNNCAIIREVHVYGEVLDFGVELKGKAQHSGIGKKLIHKAELIAKELEYSKIAVISSIGTRNYYKKLGYYLSKLYQIKSLD